MTDDKQRTAKEIARKVTFWAFDEQNTEGFCDEEVQTFVEASKDSIATLRKLEAQLKKLEDKKHAVASELLDKYYDSIDKVECKIASHSKEQDEISDMYFWSRLSKLCPKAFSFLEPRIEKLEQEVCACRLAQQKREVKNKRAEGMIDQIIELDR